MSYFVKSNNDVLIQFTKDQLNYCEYAKNIFTDGDGNWIESDEPLDAIYLDNVELKHFQIFLKIRNKIGESPKISEKPVVILKSEIMENGNIPTGYNVIHLPPLISADHTPFWNSKFTGIHEDYLEWLATISTTPERLFQWLIIADWMGCADLVYLIQAKCAFLIVNYIDKYMKRIDIKNPSKIPVEYSEKIKKFVEWSKDDNVINREEYEFMKEYQKTKDCYHHLTRGILLKFIRHRGLNVPRENWTADKWAEFKAKAPTFYSKLPIADADRYKLFRR
jgi:hypothetical protein